MSEKIKKIRALVIKIGSMGGTFLGEHGFINESILSGLTQELSALLTQAEEDYLDGFIDRHAEKYIFLKVFAEKFKLKESEGE